MEYRKLGNTDLEVSILGYGASPLGNEFETIDIQEGERAVHAAIDHGINYFDVAPYYGRTLAEERLGKALEGRRDKVVLATKCCRDDVDGFDFSAKRVLESIDESLERLRTDCVDLYQIHDIEFGDRRQVIEEAVPAAREVQKSGKARYIGITGFPLKILRDVASEVPVDTILSYARYNLMVTDLDELLRPFCEENGIGLIKRLAASFADLDGPGSAGLAPGVRRGQANGSEAGRVVPRARSEHLRRGDAVLFRLPAGGKHFGRHVEAAPRRTQPRRARHGK